MKKAKNELVKFSLLILIILIIAGGFIFYLSIPFLSGKTLILDTHPVDPFDPLRGQYISIAYEISIISTPQDAKVGNTIYVLLAKDEKGISRYESSSLAIPKSGDFIKGEIEYISGNRSRVEYGIEQYFFEKDAVFPTRGIQIEVAISSSGRARILNIIQDGKPVKIEYENKTLTG